jgi:hypothetical protein
LFGISTLEIYVSGAIPVPDTDIFATTLVVFAKVIEVQPTLNAKALTLLSKY